MVFILDRNKRELVDAEIVEVGSSSVPLKKDGWKFNWRQLANDKNGRTFVLRTLNSPNQIEGALHLKNEFDMLVMDVLELAPHNVGSENKRYDYVAGCLIAFACRESFKIEGDYKGFLTFVSKSSLIGWYTEKYGAQLALGQRMFIDCDAGEKLIDEFLGRTKRSKDEEASI